MTLEMRELRGDDLFPLLNIVGKLEIKDELVKIFDGSLAPKGSKKLSAAETTLLNNKLGVQALATVVQTVFLNIGKVKSDLNGLFANLTDTDVQTISELGLVEYGALVTAFFKKPELVGFFKSIASLM